jgi:NAD(P)-dependent dehydrogenase (short-subunit alcohol dehydrogenase family)
MMSEYTIILITGVSRGIGNALLQTYVLRPNHIVIGSVRDKSASITQELEKLPVATGSRLLLVQIENSSTTDSVDATKSLAAMGIEHLDIVIANAGGSDGRQLTPLDIVSTEDVTALFKINTLGSLVLFQAVKPLLQKSKAPIWAAIGSGAASIGGMETFGTSFVPANGIAKAALNWVTM